MSITLCQLYDICKQLRINPVVSQREDVCEIDDQIPCGSCTKCQLHLPYLLALDLKEGVMAVEMILRKYQIAPDKDQDQIVQRVRDTLKGKTVKYKRNLVSKRLKLK